MQAIDPRFPPQPEQLLIPLYPLQNDVDTGIILKSIFFKQNNRRWFIEELKAACNNNIDVERSFTFLNSGSACLYEYLVWKAKTANKVQKLAVPAYCCPEVGYAIIKAAALPVFIDIDSEYGISKASIDFAKQQGATLILWPHFYGSRQHNEELLQYITDLHMDIILDEAQSFPASPINAKYKTLVSFGATKRLNGAGGGALYLPDGDERVQFLEHITNNVHHSNDEFSTILDTLSTRIKKILGHKRKLEAELPVYVEKSAEKALKQKMEVALMNGLQYAVAAKRFRQLRKQQQQLSSLYNQLMVFAKKVFGEDCMEPEKGLLSVPTILALRLPTDRRFGHSAYLASLGIQTTWYYYPINKISAFRQFESELTPNTDLLSAEVLMLPFGLGHVLKRRRRYERILAKAIKKASNK